MDTTKNIKNEPKNGVDKATKNEVNQPRLNMRLRNGSEGSASRVSQPARDNSNVTQQYGQSKYYDSVNRIESLINEAAEKKFVDKGSFDSLGDRSRLVYSTDDFDKVIYAYWAGWELFSKLYEKINDEKIKKRYDDLDKKVGNMSTWDSTMRVEYMEEMFGICADAMKYLTSNRATIQKNGQLNASGVKLPPPPVGELYKLWRNEIDNLIKEAGTLGYQKPDMRIREGDDKTYVKYYSLSIWYSLYILHEEIINGDNKFQEFKEFDETYTGYVNAMGNDYNLLTDGKCREVMDMDKKIIKVLKEARNGIRKPSLQDLTKKLAGLYSKIKEVDKDKGLHEKVGTCPEKFDSLKSLQNNADEFMKNIGEWYENIGNWYNEKVTELSTEANEANYDIILKAFSVADAAIDLQKRGLLVRNDGIGTMKVLNEFENTVINDKIQAYVNLRNNSQPSAPVGSAPAEAVSSPSGDSQNPVAVSSESSQPPINQSVNVNAGGSLLLDKLKDKLEGLYEYVKDNAEKADESSIGECKKDEITNFKNLGEKAQKLLENICETYANPWIYTGTVANNRFKLSGKARDLKDEFKKSSYTAKNSSEMLNKMEEFIKGDNSEFKKYMDAADEYNNPYSLKTLASRLGKLYSKFNEKVPSADAKMGTCGNYEQLFEQIEKLWRVIGDNCVKGEKALTHLARCEGGLQLYEASMKEGKNGERDYLSDALGHLELAIKSINRNKEDKTLFSFQDLKARLESLYGDYPLDIKMGEWGNWKDLVDRIEELQEVVRNDCSEGDKALTFLGNCEKYLNNCKEIPDLEKMNIVPPDPADPDAPPILSVQARTELCMAMDNIEDAIKWVSWTKGDKSNKGNSKSNEPVDSVVSKIGKTIGKVPGKVTEFIDKHRNKKQLSPKEIEKELGEKGNGYLSKRVEEFEQQISVIRGNFEKQNVNLESAVDNTGTIGGVCNSIINILKNSSIPKLANAYDVIDKLSKYVNNVDNKNLTNDEVIPTIAGALDELEELSKGEDERIKEIREISVKRILALIERFREVSVISTSFNTMNYTQNDRNALKKLSVFIEETLFANALRELKAAAKNAKGTEEKVQASLNKIKNDKDFDKCSLNEIKNYFDEILNLIGRMILSIGRRQKKKGRKNKGVVGKAVSAVKKAGGKALDKVGDSSVGRAGFRVGRKAGKLLDKGLTKLGFPSENAVNEKDDRKLEKCFENAGKYFVKAEKSSGKFGADEEGKVNACFTATDLIRRFKPLEKYKAYQDWYTNFKKALKSTKRTIKPAQNQTKEHMLLGKLIASLHDMKNANNITIACNGFMLGAPNDMNNTPVLTKIKKNCFKVIASRCASGINSKAFDTLVEKLLTTEQEGMSKIFTMQQYGMVSSYFDAKWDDKSANKESPAQQAQQGQQEETTTIPAEEKPPISTTALPQVPQEPESSTLLSSQYKPVSQSAHSAGKDSVILGGHRSLGSTNNKP